MITLNKKNKKKVKFFWPSRKDNRTSSSTILVNGIFITCIILSLASGFIDLVYFSGLSKSYFHLGTFPVASAILYTIISIGLISGKFWCAMKLGMLQELRSRLKAKGKPWYNNVTKAMIPWHIVHKFLIGVSIITSLSLSVVSIGSGITRNANTLKQIDTFIEQGTRYSELVNTANNTQLTTIVKKASDTSEEDSINYATEEMAKVWPLINAYQMERSEFTRAGFSVSSTEPITWKGSEIVPNDYWNSKNNSLTPTLRKYNLQAGAALMSANEQSVFNNIKTSYLNTHRVKNTDEVNKQMTSLKGSTLEEASAWITTLNSIGFTKNIEVNGVWTTIPVVFDTDPSKSTKVLVDTALTQLKAFRVDVENDSGDIGASSKIFMLVGSYIDNAKSKRSENLEDALNMEVSTGMGTTELMLMIFIALIGIVQEFLIALFTPKANIDRAVLNQVSSHLLWKDEIEKERFLISVYKDYVGDGIINQEDFEAKCKKCVALMEDSEEDIIIKYSKKAKADTVKDPAPVERTEKPKKIRRVFNASATDTVAAPIEPSIKEEILPAEQVTTDFDSELESLINEAESRV